MAVAVAAIVVVAKVAAVITAATAIAITEVVTPARLLQSKSMQSAGSGRDCSGQLQLR